MPENPNPAGDDQDNGPEVPPVDASQDGTQGVDAGDGDPAGADALGDPGKKALDSMKVKWHEERDKRRALEQR